MTLSATAIKQTVKPLWLVVICGGAVLGLSMGFRQTFGLYLDPISQELGLGRTVFALSMGIQNILWGVSAPLAGAIADKWGAGRVIVVGALLYAVGLAMLASAPGEAGLLTSGVVLGLGVSGTGFTAVLGAVGRAAPPERRSSALGLASMGGSLGQFLLLPYAQAFIGTMGWYVSLLVLAVTALFMVPLAWGLAGTPRSDATPSDQSLAHAFREALRHKGFLLLNAGFFVCGFHITFVGTHLPAFVIDLDFAPWLGSAALMVIGVANIVGTYVWGHIGERIEKRVALSVLYFARAGVFLAILMLPLTVPTLLVICVALGFLWLGTIPLTSALVATLFGPKWMSMLFGIVFLSHQIGSFLGVWLGGYLYDLFGSYDIMWWLSVALGVAAAALHWPIKEEPVPRLQAEQAQSA